ncbi:MAG: hypothetical protein ACK4KW_15310, partial [Gemmobacter sp.]
KTGSVVEDAQLRRVWRDEIGGDVFELWIGVSRLMARVHGTERPELARRSSGGRSRRPSRHRVGMTPDQRSRRTRT